jgi:Biotin-protein ligase, N terminal
MDDSRVLHSPNMPALSRILSVASLVLISAVGAACGPRGHEARIPANTAILLFNGTGTSPNDVAAFERVLSENQLDYSTASSSRLDGLSESQIREYRLLIVPGGNFIEIGNGLTPTTTANIRNAVQSGLNYLGVCAGAFVAGNSPYNGLNLTSGVKFGFYSAEERGIRKAAVPIATAGAPMLEHYWEDGPQLAGWGAVVGKYPDGTPATVQGTFGSGSVILTGVHPEAPEHWRHGMTFTTPASADNAYAATLVHAALNRVSLAHY